MAYPKTLEQALRRHFVEEGDDCWPWTGNIRNSGYARVSFQGQLYYAHRAAFEVFVGPIPDGMTVDHDCHNRDPACVGGVRCLHRRCVRWDHLVLETTEDNTSKASLSVRVGRCRRGHRYTVDNLYVIKGRLPVCRACQLMRQHRYEDRKTVAAHKAEIAESQKGTSGG